MAATLLILLGGIIGVGFIGNLFFEKTRIPSVLLPTLSAAGKWIDIVLMFCGRVLYPIFVMRIIRDRRESFDPVPSA